jgi:hypothetical protein
VPERKKSSYHPFYLISFRSNSGGAGCWFVCDINQHASTLDHAGYSSFSISGCEWNSFTHHRAAASTFSSHPPVEPGAILRQAIWVGIYSNLLAWLQLGRVLNLSLTVFLAIGFVVIEVILRLREKTQWTPGDEGQ